MSDNITFIYHGSRPIPVGSEGNEGQIVMSYLDDGDEYYVPYTSVNDAPTPLPISSSVSIDGGPEYERAVYDAHLNENEELRDISRLNRKIHEPFKMQFTVDDKYTDTYQILMCLYLSEKAVKMSFFRHGTVVPFYLISGVEGAENCDLLYFSGYDFRITKLGIIKSEQNEFNEIRISLEQIVVDEPLDDGDNFATGLSMLVPIQPAATSYHYVSLRESDGSLISLNSTEINGLEHHYDVDNYGNLVSLFSRREPVPFRAEIWITSDLYLSPLSVWEDILTAYNNPITANRLKIALKRANELSETFFKIIKIEGFASVPDGIRATITLVEDLSQNVSELDVNRLDFIDPSTTISVNILGDFSETYSLDTQTIDTGAAEYVVKRSTKRAIENLHVFLSDANYTTLTAQIGNELTFTKDGAARLGGEIFMLSEISGVYMRGVSGTIECNLTFTRKILSEGEIDSDENNVYQIIISPNGSTWYYFDAATNTWVTWSAGNLGPLIDGRIYANSIPLKLKKRTSVRKTNYSRSVVESYGRENFNPTLKIYVPLDLDNFWNGALSEAFSLGWTIRILSGVGTPTTAPRLDLTDGTYFGMDDFIIGNIDLSRDYDLKVINLSLIEKGNWGTV